MPKCTADLTPEEEAKIRRTWKNYDEAPWPRTPLRTVLALYRRRKWVLLNKPQTLITS
jgi:hypothetical protein